MYFEYQFGYNRDTVMWVDIWPYSFISGDREHSEENTEGKIVNT